MTPLHDAVLRNSLEIVKVLIKFGANPTIQNTKDGKSPIDQACDKEDLLNILKTSSYLHNNETKVTNILSNGLKESLSEPQEQEEEKIFEVSFKLIKLLCNSINFMKAIQIFCKYCNGNIYL